MNDTEVIYKEKGASLMSTFINAVNCIIGAGILSIPVTIHKTGVVGSLFLLLTSLCLSLFGCYFLTVAATYTQKDSLGEMANILYGRVVSKLADITLIIYEIGVSTVYNIILYEQVLDLLETWGGISAGWLWNNRWVSVHHLCHP